MEKSLNQQVKDLKERVTMVGTGYWVRAHKLGLVTANEEVSVEALLRKALEELECIQQTLSE